MHVLRILFSYNLLSALADSKTIIVDNDSDNVSKTTRNADSEHNSIARIAPNQSRQGMVLSFQPISLAFSNVNYYVNMPAVSHIQQFIYIYARIYMKFLIN